MRRLGAAAVDMSHVALGIVEAYWEYRLKPWDMAAGVLVTSHLIYPSYELVIDGTAHNRISGHLVIDKQK